MSSLNKFSISLSKQKKLAKKRLKDIRDGDINTFNYVSNHHPYPASLHPKQIKLADVQFSLARELGLRSWRGLLCHISELETQKLAIASADTPVDNELFTLHVRCGHDIQFNLQKAGFSGDFLPLIDPLCIGVIPEDDKSFIHQRAAYVVKHLLPIMNIKKDVEELYKEECLKIATLLDEQYDRIVIWVEHDSYDQLMLLRSLNLLMHKTHAIIEIVEADTFPGPSRFIGLGQLPPEALRSLWKKRRAVTPRTYDEANICWQAFTCHTPEKLVALLNSSIKELPYVKGAAFRILQELPCSLSGLSLTNKLTLEILNSVNRPITVKELFSRFQKADPLPTLGDVMFFALIQPLAFLQKPVIAIDASGKCFSDYLISITDTGKSCLTGEQTACLDYDVAGIHVGRSTRWTWDHKNLDSLKYTCS